MENEDQHPKLSSDSIHTVWFTRTHVNVHTYIHTSRTDNHTYTQTQNTVFIKTKTIKKYLILLDKCVSIRNVTNLVKERL